MSASDLVSQDACAVVDLLRREAVSPHDLLDALERRIAAVDPAVNALPTLCFERARAAADRLMRKPVGERGLLAGLPVAIKDLNDVAGVRTTYGSPIFRDHVPARSDILVDILEARGAIVYAKSNTPEFGAGANTFNEVFGATRNPWNTARSAAGSSGGGRGRARDRHGVARARHRSRRIAAQPGELLRHRGLATEHRPRGPHPDRQDRPHAVGQRPDGAHGRGPGADARRHVRRASGRPAVAAGAAGARSSTRRAHPRG